jgi:hypothetical protein
MPVRTLRDLLTPILKERFGDRQFSMGAGKQIATFAAAHPDFGGLVILDDGDEATVAVGRLTHTHFGPVGDVSVTEDVEMIILQPVVEFLGDLFADRLLVWCVPGKRAGYQSVNNPVEHLPKDAMMFVWSGPWRAGADAERLCRLERRLSEDLGWTASVVLTSSMP